MSKKEVSFKEFAVLMALLMSIVAISIDAMLPALGLVASDFALADRNHAQYVIGCIFIGMGAGQLVCGPLSDAIGRKPVLYASILLYFVGSLACYLAPSFEWLIAGRLVQGLAVAGPYVSTVSIVRDKYAGRDMARVMSIVMMIFIMVPAIAPTLGQAIMAFAHWRAIFLMYVLYALVIGVWTFLRLEETLPPARRVPMTLASFGHGLREVLGNHVALCYTICMGITFGSFIGYLNSSQQIFVEKFHTGGLFTVYFGGLALVLGVASMLNSRIVERLGMRHICLRSFIGIIVASAIFLAVNLSLGDVTLPMFVAYAAVLFFCFGLVFGNLNALAMEPMGHIAGMASAVIGASSSLISMTLGSYIGQLYNGTLVPIATGFLTLSLLSLGIMLWAGSRRHAPGYGA
ncbi:MAG TPA: multidrug effflux MFS transporter [Patescibacteria group bacterium]|nr:multidrug effflux MFS transporter [Patescibacteria group bacterium]